jgi:2-keto-4-pentenoate hydratase/2-oxohepta-3-ene-1,7-dioic acid hydratase in catechol pathway
MKKEYEYINGSNKEVGTIYCIGRNYAEHAKELGNEVPTEPVVFIKPPNSYTSSGSKVAIPNYSELMHHEVEVVFVLGKDTMGVSPSESLEYVDGVAVGIDFTLRDVQNKIKEKGLPWSMAKSFMGSAPISPIVDIKDISNVDDIEFQIAKNGITTQKGNTKNMINDIRQIIAHISKVFGLRKGDCIFTGTPKGVGPVEPGDKLIATLANKVKLEIEIE